MQFFSGRFTQEQTLSGLQAAAIGGMLGVPAIVTNVIMHNAPQNVVLLVVAFAVASIPAIYINTKLYRARQLGERINTSPTASFLTTCCSSAALVIGQLATYHWSGDVYLAALVLPCVFFAVIGDTPMIAAGLVVTLVGIVICLSVGPRLSPAAYVSLFIMYASIDILGALMVAPAIRRLHNRWQSRDAVRAVTEVLAQTETVNEGIERCLPLIHTVVPCQSAAVVVRNPGAGWTSLVTLSEWHAEGADPARITAEDLPAELTVTGGPVVVDHQCFVPIGYSAAGEMILVISEMESRSFLTVFAAEATAGLATSFLLQTSRINYMADLKLESRTDALTGLANRRSLEERLEIELAKSNSTGSAVSVAMVDLDHFKDINDRLGHQRGDQVLVNIAGALSERLRTDDLMARYGGEEFCAVLPNTRVDQAHKLIDDLRSVVYAAGEDGCRPTISAGVAMWNGTESVQALLDRADKALYHAKESGRNQVAQA